MLLTWLFMTMTLNWLVGWCGTNVVKFVFWAYLVTVSSVPNIQLLFLGFAAWNLVVLVWKMHTTTLSDEGNWG